MNFRFLSSGWPHFFLTIPTPNIFSHLLICVNLYQNVKKQLNLFVHSWDKVNFRVQRPDWLHHFLIMSVQKNFQSTFRSCEFVSTCKKWGCFINVIWRNSIFKNPAIWLAESILAYISGTGFFPNIGFVQQHSK